MERQIDSVVSGSENFYLWKCEFFLGRYWWRLWNDINWQPTRSQWISGCDSSGERDFEKDNGERDWICEEIMKIFLFGYVICVVEGLKLIRQP